MINVNDFKPGITFKYKNNVYIVIDSNHSKSGRGQSHVKTKVKDLITNKTINLTFIGGEKVDTAFIEKVEISYLYDDKLNAIFMNSETFQQEEIPLTNLTWEKNFLKESLNLKLKKYGNKIIGIELPKLISFKVIYSEGATKGNTVNNPLKKAKIETEYELDVPQFIQKDDIIIVNTETGKYSARGKIE